MQLGSPAVHVDIINHWPRAVIFEIYCDPYAGIGSPDVIYEWPIGTYKSKRVKYLCLSIDHFGS